MKESTWRSILVKKYKANNHENFIWIHSAKFISGFPDVYVIKNGISFHYELKVTKKFHFGSKDLEKLFEKIQLSVMRSINKAGGQARGLIYENSLDTTYVWMIDFQREIIHRFEPEKFYTFWTLTDHSWAAALGS